jgi:hypothetical protein
MHPGYDAANFHRVVIHGSTLPLEWLKPSVDPRANGTGDTAFGPFSWTRQPQPGYSAHPPSARWRDETF